nr:ABC transporter substrate-binding protein [Streptomyces griseiscabiei]
MTGPHAFDLPRSRLTLALTPLPAGCFVAGEEGSGSGKEGGSAGWLRVALAVPPVQVLSPYSNDATVLSKLSVAEGLTALDENGAAVPVLAKSWKKTDATTWTFELREATFQDGTPVTAESVVNALGHANAAEPKPRVLSDVALTVKAEDADTVTIGTKDADLVLPLRLASPAPAVLAGKAYGKGGTVSPIGTGTGPFKITKLTGKSKAPMPCAAAMSTSPSGFPPPRRSCWTRKPVTRCRPYGPTASSSTPAAASSPIRHCARPPRGRRRFGARRLGLRRVRRPRAGSFGPAVSWAVPADQRVQVTGRAKPATPAQVKAETKGKTRAPRWPNWQQASGVSHLSLYLTATIPTRRRAGSARSAASTCPTCTPSPEVWSETSTP